MVLIDQKSEQKASIWPGLDAVEHSQQLESANYLAAGLRKGLPLVVILRE